MTKYKKETVTIQGIDIRVDKKIASAWKNAFICVDTKHGIAIASKILDCDPKDVFTKVFEWHTVIVNYKERDFVLNEAYKDASGAVYFITNK